MKEKAIQEFKKIYGGDGDIRTYFAPGRVNLIGEHTDYNGGHVFPCALTIGTYAVARRRNDRKLRFYSANFRHLGVSESSLDELYCARKFGWTNYPKGVMWVFGQKGYDIPYGFDILLSGNIPNGSGLSSSASVEVVIAVMLRDMYGFDISNMDIALMCQYGENHYNGVNCGIMDQFAIAMGKKDNAIFLDTGDLTYQYAPIILDGARIVIANTNKKRGLGDSKYNERRRECDTSLEELKKELPIRSLGELTEEQFEACKHLITDPVRVRRVRHAVTENQRTIRAVEALRQGDVKLFGQLMNQSHISLRDDYEVTGPELDALVEAAWAQPGVIGARMTGAGFGGCAVSIVETMQVDPFIENVGRTYKEKIGYGADFYVVDIGDGAGPA